MPIAAATPVVIDPLLGGERSASHRTTVNDGLVTIHDLELFVGFDPSIDDDDDKRIKKYDKAAIEKVVDRTHAYMKRGQNPKLILGHNPDGGSDFARPTLGDIVAIRATPIHGTPGIVGDVEMSASTFAAYIKNNEYPRRSAEIWRDGYLSEVALLGSETPARPLPDTKFGRAEHLVCTSHRDCFSRDFPAMQFAEPTATAHAPGPGNTHIPGSTKKEPQMADDDNKPSELDQLKAKLKAKEDECTALKNKLKAKNSAEEDDDSKEENARLARERDQFKRQANEAVSQVNELRQDIKRERYTRLLEAEHASGLRVGDADQFSEILDRIVKAEDPDAELEFFKTTLPKDPIGLRLDQSIAQIGGTDATPDQDKMARAAKAATDRCTREGKTEMYGTYYAEAMNA